jgi:flagellar protein FlbD
LVVKAQDGPDFFDLWMGTMIVVTRLNDQQFAINPDLIERIHASPDTTLVMVDGAKYIVTEPMTEVIDRIALYRAKIISLAQSVSTAESRGAGWQLGLVPEGTDDDDADDTEDSDEVDRNADDPGGESAHAAYPLRPRKI